MSATKRTDIHRKGAIIPAHYEHLFSFNLSTTYEGWPVASSGINCELDGQHFIKDSEGRSKCVNGQHADHGECCVVALRQGNNKFASHGSPGKCTACGATFVYGDCYRHLETNEVIFLGHDCADKYRMLFDRSVWELNHHRERQAAAVACERAHKADAREAFLRRNECKGLREAFDLATSTEITKDNRYPVSTILDMKDRFTKKCELSPKAVTFALKLADQIRNPPAPEKHVEAPTGRIEFTGTVVSIKTQEGFYGITYKMTIKVHSPNGSWLAWGTMPAALVDNDECRTGAVVNIRATLKPGNDKHFALMGRPTGKLVKAAPKTANTNF